MVLKNSRVFMLVLTVAQFGAAGVSAACAASDDGQSHDAAASREAAGAGDGCENVAYNRSIELISFSSSEIVVEHSLRVGEQGATLDLASEIVVEVFRGGTMIAQQIHPIDPGIVPNDAITCAVTCASDCGSIFGDGVCYACNCDYLRSEPVPLGFALETGDQVRATILPLVVPEIITEDDVLEVTFGEPLSCCPADLNHDGAVNAADLAQLLGAWGPCQ